jgi:nucleoid-associated protein
MACKKFSVTGHGMPACGTVARLDTTPGDNADMEIRNAVVHRIEKQRNVRGAAVILADEEIVKDEALSVLLQHVLTSYNNRSSRHTGSFEADEENYRLSVGVRSFLNGESDFIEFSATAMERLRVKINDVMFATGGYVLFVRYTHGGRDMLLIAKLSQEDGAIFSSDLHRVVQASYLNLDRLQVAARLDIAAWNAEGDRYLTFVLKEDRGQPADYFQEFIGCQIDQDSKIESNKVVVVVKGFVAKLVEDLEIAQDRAPDIQRRAYDYALELRRSPDSTGLSFEGLANAVWPDDPELFLGYLNTHDEQPSAGFMPDKTVFKKLSSINFRSKDLTVKMTYDFKQSHVSTDGRTVVINDAPEKLIRELTEG